ncbi:hypothetical protein IWW45_006363 [Coemansia sp. RSA 485]|nr:hypothetical protein IWW45_006363 [Coemansia sp. RSA 485]
MKKFGTLVQDHFKQVFGEANALERIPVYGTNNVQPKPKLGTLMRFRCMVQDPSYGEELHLSVAQLVNTATGEVRQKFSQYTDNGPILDENWEVDYVSAGNKFIEKEVAYCVSVPGQTKWAEMNTAGNLEEAMEALDICPATDEEELLTGSAEKYPLRGQKHAAALVKFYAPGNAPKVSEIVDVVGIFELGYNPREEPQQSEEQDARWPCLHSIFHNTVSVESLVSGLPMISAADEYMDRRNMCLSHLTSVLGDDSLAAHYLLLHLLSSTVVVQGTKVGKFSLNLIGYPAAASAKSENDVAECSGQKEPLVNGGFVLDNLATKRVGDALAQLVPWCVEVPFELKLLNNTSFAPNAEGGDLRAGVLQLAPSTQMVCDETCLHEGTLNERGVRNLHALQTTILDQTVTYMYPFQPIEMACNLRILVLSTGKSILHNDCDLYLAESAVQLMQKINNGEKANEPKLLDPMHSEQLRQYLEMARNLEFSVPKEVSDRISEEYAQMRRRAHESNERMVSQAELALAVTVARLISVSKGEAELSWDSWTEACALEVCRAERNARFAAKNKAASEAAQQQADTEPETKTQN